MRPTFRVTRHIVVALAVAGVTLVGWVARSTLAQDGPKVSLPANPAEALPPASDPAPVKLAEPPSDLSSPPQGTPYGAPPPQATPYGAPPPQATPYGAPGTSAMFAPNPAGPGDDDPEKNARDFVERNRREAQEELKKLKDEAQRLRTRLGKVEAGIQRWDALLAALENSEKVAAAGAAGKRRPPAARVLDAEGVETR